MHVSGAGGLRRAAAVALTGMAALVALAALVSGDAVAAAPSGGNATAAERGALAALSGRIVVPRARGVAVVDPGTAEANMLFGGGSAAGGTATGVAWSPVSRRLAVSVQQRQAGERYGGADILVLDASGATVGSIDRDDRDVVLDAPVWLPDGEVAYARSVVGGPEADSRVEASLPDGSARRVLASSARLPGVSPDGTHLAYVTPSSSGGRLVSLDLSSGARLTLADAGSLGFAYFSAPRFSPDGQFVAFGASGGPSGPGTFGGVQGLFMAPLSHGPNWDLWVVNADGSGLRQATIIPEGDDLYAAWSPDGQWLAAYGPPGLYLVPAFQPGPTTPILTGGVGQPDWAAGL
jgi:Tol biopolymer transport system component